MKYHVTNVNLTTALNSVPVDGEDAPLALPEGGHGEGDGRVEVAARHAAARQDADHEGEPVAEGDGEEVRLGGNSIA